MEPPDDEHISHPQRSHPSPFLPPPSKNLTTTTKPPYPPPLPSSIQQQSQQHENSALTIRFETGNPATGSVISGILQVSPLIKDKVVPPIISVESVPGVMTSAEFCNFVISHCDSIVHLRTLRLRTRPNQYVVVIQLKSFEDALAFSDEFAGKSFLRDLSDEICVIRAVHSIQFDEPTVVLKDDHNKTNKGPQQTETDKELRAHDGDDGGNEHEDEQSPAVTTVAESEEHSSSLSLSLSSSTSSTLTTTSSPRGFPQARMFPSNLTSTSHEAIDIDDIQEQRSEETVLPSCTVCLEGMDTPSNSTTALVTVFCNHTLHAACLAKWGLNWCPVCRHAHVLTPEATVCMRCGQRDDLWMCVVCAYVGCGFYQQGKHAYEHFRDTLHPFATNLLECTFWTGDVLKPGCVWDYSAERFVNRLVTSDDGKIVEVKGGNGNGNRSIIAGTSSSSSASSTTVIPSNNSQQQHQVRQQQPQKRAASHRNNSGGGGTSSSLDGGFIPLDEDDMLEREVQAAMYVSRMDADVTEYRRRLATMEAEHASEKDRLEQEITRLRKRVTEVCKERKAFSKKLSESERELKGLRDKYDFLKNLNETLLRDKQGWDDAVKEMKQKVGVVEAEKVALKDQLRDLMLHLETQNQINPKDNAGPSSSSGNDVQGHDQVQGQKQGQGERITAMNSNSCRSDVSELRGADVIRVGPSKRERLAMKANRKYSGS